MDKTTQTNKRTNKQTNNNNKKQSIMLRSSTTTTINPTTTSVEQQEQQPQEASISKILLSLYDSSSSSKKKKKNRHYYFFNNSNINRKFMFFFICIILLSVVVCLQLSSTYNNNDDNRSLVVQVAASTPLSSSILSSTWAMNHHDTNVQNICRGRRGRVVLNDEFASDKNKWIIVMTINDGYYDFFENWYYHYEQILDVKRNVTGFVFYAEDLISYEKLQTKFNQQQNSNVIQIIPTHLEKVTGASSSSSSFSFGNWKYVTLVAKRPTRLLDILCLGYNVLYVDADTIWKSNPFLYFQSAQQRQQQQDDNVNVNVNVNDVDNNNNANDIDIIDKTNRKKTIEKEVQYVEYDGYMIIDWPTDAYSHGYNLCTGFMAIKATRWGIQWIYDWQQALVKKDMNQGIFNKVYSDYYKYHVVLNGDDNEDSSSSLLLRGTGETNNKNNKAATVKKHIKHIIRPLPFKQFPNGREYFERMSEKERSEVMQVHANFIIGHDNKKSKLIEYGLWKV